MKPFSSHSRVKIMASQLRHLCQRLYGVSRLGRNGMLWRTRVSQLIQDSPSGTRMEHAGLFVQFQRRLVRARGLVRILGLCDQAADDEDRGTGVEGGARRHDALLVARVAAGGAHPGNDEE